MYIVLFSSSLFILVKGCRRKRGIPKSSCAVSHLSELLLPLNVSTQVPQFSVILLERSLEVHIRLTNLVYVYLGSRSLPMLFLHHAISPSGD